MTTNAIIILVVISIVCFSSGILLTWLTYFLLYKKRKKINQEKEKKTKKLHIDEINAIKKEFESKLQESKNLEWLKQQEFLKTEKNLNKRTKYLMERELMLDNLEKHTLEKEKNIIKKMKKINKELENISGISSEEAKNKLLNNLELDLQKQMNKKIIEHKRKLKNKRKEIASNIISNAMEEYAPIFVADKTISIVKFKNDEIKGRIIGKEGRNIRAFEKYSGVDLLINDAPGIIRLSSFNIRRREIAKSALKKIISDNRVQINKIEEYLKIAEKDFDKKISEIGLNIVEQLSIFDMNPDFCYNIGLLKYRTSYGQNVLEHSIEVGKIAASIASELNLDSAIALRGGLLHDIGKSIDQEINESHVTIGVRLAKQYNESKTIVNIIESHHGDVEPDNIYSIIVSAADTISAARPGARNNSIENFIQRMSDIEKTCMNIKGVSKCYAFQSGRQIRVIVDSKNVDDLEAYKISKKLKEEILNSDIIIPGDISINVIRELSISDTFTK